MKTKIVFFTVAVLASLGLQADTLYWQINSNPNNDQYAALVVLQNGEKVGYATLLDGDGGNPVSPLADASDAMSNIQYADVTGYDSTYSFYVEMLSLVNDEWQQGWTGPLMNYDDITNYISDGGINAGSVQTFTASVTIPEPTSGLLLLVGGSLLALRRKRRA